MKHATVLVELIAAAAVCSGAAGCESASRKIEDNRGALLGAAVGTGAGLAMKNNASRGENLDIYTGVGALAGYTVGKSFDEQRRSEEQGITEEDMLRFIEQLPDDWLEPVTLPPPADEIGPQPWPGPLPLPPQPLDDPQGESVPDAVPD